MAPFRYTVSSLVEAIRSVGVKQGDLVYLSTQLYGVGPIDGISSRNCYLSAVYDAFRSVIGREGTLVVPTFTQQVGRFGVPFVLETTECLTGIFCEYVRQLEGSVRSLHPVFSVSAIGPKAESVCNDVSGVAFGYDSAFDRIVRLGGKAVCIGFDFYSGHIVSLMHYVETAFAVPYYYNKLVTAPVYASGRMIDKPFVINVKYRDVGCEFDYRRYIDVLSEARLIRSAKIGRGEIHAVLAQEMFQAGVEMLKHDIYAFLAQPPTFVPGVPPADGPPEPDQVPEGGNWSGFYLGVR